MPTTRPVPDLFHRPREAALVEAAPSTEVQRTLVDQRMCARLVEARDVRLARRTDRGETVRLRVGRAIVGLGCRIAGADHGAMRHAA